MAICQVDAIPVEILRLEALCPEVVTRAVPLLAEEILSVILTATVM